VIKYLDLASLGIAAVLLFAVSALERKLRCGEKT
jgi:hypothetical protein